MLAKLIISGPSAVGKDAVISELLNRLPNAKLAISMTTRTPRPGEIHGVDYHFLDSVTDFETMISSGKLLEYTICNGHYYGTPVEETAKPGEILIYNVDPAGCRNLKSHCPDAVSVFLAAPGAVVEKRLRNRDNKHATEEDIQSRMETAEEILSYATEYDYFLLNDSIRSTVNRLEQIINVLAFRPSAQLRTIEEIIMSFHRNT